MLKNSLFQPSLSFCFSVPHFSPALTFFFSFGCPLFFSPKYFFSAQTFLLQFSHSSLLLFSALFFSVAAQKYYIQPKTFFFSSTQNTFQFSPTHFFFSFLFCFQHTFFISVQRLLLLLLFSAPFSCL